MFSGTPPPYPDLWNQQLTGWSAHKIPGINRLRVKFLESATYTIEVKVSPV